jgi:predicted secreted Zn-dependent protease
MRNPVVLLLAAASMAAACSRSSSSGPQPDSPVQIDEQDKSYSINALSADDLIRSFSEQWRCAGGECKVGETGSRVSWHFATLATSPEKCVVTDVHVVLNLVVTTPQWDWPSGTSSARRQWWQHIQAEIVQHEHEHARIAQDGANAIATALQAVSAPNCAAARAGGDDAAKEQYRITRERQTEFDRARGVNQIPPIPP